MGEVIPYGNQGKAMVNLRNLIAESAAFQEAVTNQFTVSGTLSPDVTGTYVPEGFLDDKPCYKHDSSDYWIWWSSSAATWYITDEKGDPGTATWSLNTADILGDYTAGAGATGTATVAVVGSSAQKIANAKAALHIASYETAGSFARPFGLISQVGNIKNEGIAVSEFETGGDLEVQFQATIPTVYVDDDPNAELNFLNLVDEIIEDMKTLSSQPGYFAINNIDAIEGPMQIEVDAGAHVYGIRYLINWGLS